MKDKAAKNEKIFQKQYKKIMKDYHPTIPISNTPQWSNPGDYIVKFSLYKDSPNSITSTDSSAVSPI